MANILKKVVAMALAASATMSLSAQDLTTYFMPNVIENRTFNASFAPNRGYVNIPIVGATTLSANGNVSLGDLIYPVDGVNLFLLDSKVSAEDALSGLQENNYFGMESRLSLLGFGSYMADKKTFWSFDLNLRTTASMSASYDLFEFLKTAPEQATINNAGQVYMESYVEAAFGLSRPLFAGLTVGGRVKLLAGLMNATMDIDQMDVTLTSDEWRVKASGFLDLNAKGTSIESSIDDTGEIFELGDLEAGISGVAGFGAAIDLGASYDFSDRLHFSAAANDVGFIVWGKGASTTASLVDEFSFTGANIDIDDSGASVDDSTMIDLDELEFEKGESRASTKWLQANINMGAEYNIFGELLSAGAVYSMKFWRTETIHNLTMALTTSPLKWVTVAASYSHATNNSNSFGCAANIATRFMNLYVSTDIMTAKKSAQLVPINQTMMNVSFGLAVPLARVGER